MDPGDHSISLDEFKQWRVESLKDFLTKRGMSREGNKDELAALCFAASTLNLPLVMSQQQVLETNKTCYEEILKSASIPDPFLLYDNWIEEKSGKSFWPPNLLSDVTTFFLCKGDASHVNNMLKDYKIGKAYEYYVHVSGWLQEVYLHNISKSSPVCIMKTTCFKSQRLREDPHDVWVCIVKATGAVKAAFCSCTAGLGQTCNHVAALLFRIEAVNRFGLSSCTSDSCVWNAPVNVKKLEPSKLKDLHIIKSSRAKKTKSRPLVNLEKRKYQPLEEQPKPEDTVSSIVIALRGLLPNACLFTALQKDDESTETEATDKPRDEPKEVARPESTEESATGTSEESVKTLSVVNYNLQNIVKKFKSQTSCYDFLSFLSYFNRDEINFIETSTVGQHENQSWIALRQGRITASRFYNVYTRVNTVLKSDDSASVDCSSLLKSVMGYNPINPNIKSLKYGRETEPIAVEAYLKSYKKKHSNVIYRNCGMFIDSKSIFLAATPDLLVNCSCWGKGLLEVKCPMVKECLKCSDVCCCSNNVPDYLIFQNNTFCLKQNHSYYAQIQGQLFITERNWCDLFIYTVNGYLTQRINLDQEYCDKMIPNLKYFFVNYVIPELLSPKLQTNPVLPEPMEIDNNVPHTYFCPVCRNVIKEIENVSTFNDRSVGCDKCQLWYHFRCVNFKKSDSKKAHWTCSKCT